jgi:LysR family transcriptional regulator, transcriptional activator for dmlA
MVGCVDHTGAASEYNRWIHHPSIHISCEIVRQWALDGHCIVLRSAWDVESSLAQGKLLRILPVYQQTADVWAVTTSRLSSSAKVRAYVRFLQHWLQARA